MPLRRQKGKSGRGVLREPHIFMSSIPPCSKSRKTARLGLGLCATALAGTLLVACAPQINRHGHVFNEVDLEQVQPGMSKDQVTLALGTPDTTSTVGGDAYYYIQSTSQTRPMGKPKIIDRKVVAVYFDQSDQVAQLAHYGLKDGRVFDFLSNETRSRGKEVTFLEQMFGNLGTRREYAKQLAKDSGGSPRSPGPPGPGSGQ